jgi:cobalt-zinc-cadmium resistance protein CzcA
MLKPVIAFCLSRRAIVLFCFLAFALAGFVAFKQLNIEAYPNPTPVILEITAQAPGLSAEEMERYYTVPIEIGLYTTPGISVIRSTSFYGLSFIRVVFKYGVDYHFAYAQADIAIQQNVTLPAGQIPQIQQNSSTGEIYRYQVVGPKHFGLTNLRTVQDWIVLRRLSTIPGIVQVNSWGGTTKEFDVEVDPRKLEAYNVTVPQILTALGNANINVGGREIRIGQQSINIRGVGLINDGGDDDLTKGYKVADIENVVLSQSNGVPVIVKDVANVKVSFVPRLGICGRDNEDDVAAAIVVMSRVEQTAKMLPKVKAEIAKMNTDGSLPTGVKLVPFYDRGSLINVTTHTVLHNLIFGCVLVFLIQWIFLGDLRSAIIVGVNIPFALFFAIMILLLRGESANLLSVGAVDLGIIVDFAVILVENIFRNLQRNADERQTLLQRLTDGFYGPDPTQALHSSAIHPWTDRLRMIFISAMQVDKAVLFSALITVAGFVPLFTMEGVEGQIFGPMARTYGYALAGALISTFTITPVLASFFLPNDLKETETILVRLLHRVYNPALRFALKHRAIMVVIGLVFLVATACLSLSLGSEFLPHLEEGNFWIRASMPMTLSLEDGEAAARKMRQILMRHPEVVTVVSQHIQDNIEEAISGVKGANSVKIIGPNLEMLEKFAAQVRDEMSHVRGVADLGIFPLLGQPNLNIKVDRAKAARYGLNSGDVTTVIQAALGGAAATTVLEGDRQFGVVVRFAPEFRDSVEKIRNIKVAYPTPSGANSYIPLSELATITLDTGAAWIYHESTQRYIPVKFSVRNRDLGSTVAEAQARIAKIKLPSGYRMVWAGEFEDLQNAKHRLELIVPISLALIVGLLYCLYNSVWECVLTLTGILFAAAGGVLALYITGLNFSISAAVGFVSLLGVSVMNGILLLTYYNQASLRGGTPVEVMFRAASTRMRPLLMTSFSACIGLLPAAVSRGIGSQVQRPLATVIVGGMFVGPIMLLLVVPALKIVVMNRVEKSKPQSQ